MQGNKEFRSMARNHLFGLCKAFKCQPFVVITSLTSKMLTPLDPKATMVMSGLPITYNPGISLILKKGRGKAYDY